MNANIPKKIDGRRRRSEQSRDRIIAAIMALVEESGRAPSAEEVAARAQVGLRSVFRHFKDMESLFAEMTVRVTMQYQDALGPMQATDWRGRLHEGLERRLAIYERLLPFRRASDAFRHHSAVIQDYHERLVAMLRGRLESHVPDTLRADTVRLESLDLVLSFESYQRLRQDQHLDAARAAAVIRGLVERLIATE